MLVGRVGRLLSQKIKTVIESVTKETILAMQNLVAWVVDSETNYTATQSVDITGIETRIAESGRCYSFDGADDLLLVFGGAIPLGTSNFSLAFRFLIDGSATGDNCIISDSTTTTSQFLGYNATTNNFTIQLNGTTVNLPYTLTVDTWYHIVVNYARGGNARLYVDSVGNTPVSISGESAYSLTKAMFIGNASFGGTNVLLGKINDFRIYDSTLSQTEVNNLYDYSAEPNNTLLLQYKCEEGTSVYTFDSSGNAHHGVAAFASPSTFMLADNNIFNSYANNYGYSIAYGYSSGSAYSTKTYDSTLADIKEIEIKVFIALNPSSSFAYAVSKAPSGGAVNSLGFEGTAGKFSYFDASGTKVVTRNITNGEIHTFKLTFDGTAVELFEDGVSVDTGTASSSNPFDATNDLFVGGDASGNKMIGAIFSLTLKNSLGATVLTLDNLTNNSVLFPLIPRDESDVLNDISGSVLEHTGKPRYNFDLVKSNCISFYGNEDRVDFGDIGNVVTFEMWIKFDDDNAAIIQLADSPTKATLEVSANVLTAGVGLTSPIYTIDGNVVTASAGGAILNDNEWHYFKVDCDVVDANSVKIGHVSGSPSGNRYCNININDGQVIYPCAEGAGIVVYDTSGSGNHGAFDSMDSTAWANTQDFYHYNLFNGFEMYTDDATELIEVKVPYNDDASKITPTISDYTKQSENTAGNWHNNAETKLNATSIPAILLANNSEGNDFLFTSGTVNDLDYSDFDDDINNTSFFFSDISVANRRKNLLIFSAEKTGADLADIQSFLNH